MNGPGNKITSMEKWFNSWCSCTAGAVLAEGVPEGVPARGAGLAGHHLHTAPERDPGRRDGPGQDHHDYRPAGSPRLRKVSACPCNS